MEASVLLLGLEEEEEEDLEPIAEAALVGTYMSHSVLTC
jgi:hypothetical protein